MTLFTEVVDAAADVTTVYSMKTNDVFHGSNSSSADRDWISVYLEPGYNYVFRTVYFLNPVNNFRFYNAEGNKFGGVKYYTYGAYVTVQDEGTYFIEVRDTFSAQQAENEDYYGLRMAETPGKKWDGTNGRDELAGGSGRDEIRGYKGKDTLMGLDGPDLLNGGKGRDRLEGGEGSDVLRGGFGADVFVYRDVSESTAAGRGRDAIRDFSRNEGDRINLKHIDGRSGTAKNDAFTFIGTAAFSGSKGELRYGDMPTHGTYIYGTYISVDVDGDRRADLEIVLNDIIDLKASDFVL